MKRLLVALCLVLLTRTAIDAQTLIGNRGDTPTPVPQKGLTSDKPEDEEDVYFILSGEADKAIAEGDYATAEKRIVEALSVDRDNPSNVLLLSNLGMVYSYQDKDSLALEVLNEAHRRAPSMTTVLNNRAMVYLNLGDDAAAFRDFAHTISLDSLNIEARYYHGVMSLYGGDIDTARDDFRVLADHDPESIVTATAFAWLNSLTGNDREAIPYFRKLVEKDPAPEYYSALAECHLALGELSEASEVISEGLKLYGFDPGLYYCRAWLNRDSYRLNQAHEDAEKAKRLGADPQRVDKLFSK